MGERLGFWSRGRWYFGRGLRRGWDSERFVSNLNDDVSREEGTLFTCVILEWTMAAFGDFGLDRL